MKILILSDNHGDMDIVDKILKNEKHDLSIHLGDSQSSESTIRNKFNYYVEGNNDFWYSQTEESFEIEGLRFFILHGHTRGISNFSITKPLEKIFNETNADVILYGHTHEYKVVELQDKIAMCPGSLRYSRGPEGIGYCIMDIEQGNVKNITFKKV